VCQPSSERNEILAATSLTHRRASCQTPINMATDTANNLGPRTTEFPVPQTCTSTFLGDNGQAVGIWCLRWILSRVLRVSDCVKDNRIHCCILRTITEGGDCDKSWTLCSSQMKNSASPVISVFTIRTTYKEELNQTSPLGRPYEERALPSPNPNVYMIIATFTRHPRA